MSDLDINATPEDLARMHEEQRQRRAAAAAAAGRGGWEGATATAAQASKGVGGALGGEVAVEMRRPWARPQGDGRAAAGVGRGADNERGPGRNRAGTRWTRGGVFICVCLHTQTDTCNALLLTCL